MKQVIRKGIKHIIVDEVPDPLPSPHHVIIQPVSSLISSGTETADIHRESLVKNVSDNPGHLRTVWNVMKSMGPLATFDEVQAKLNNDYAVLGYSGAGVVIGKHDTVTDLEIGDPVAYGGEGTGHGERIKTGRNLVARIPEGVGFDEAAFTTLGSIALNSVRIAEIALGDIVAVIGQGLVGQLVSQLVRAQGGIAIAIDLRPERVELAKRSGASHGLLGGSGLKESIAALTGGRGVDCAIVAAAAKSSAPAKQALEICRDRGRIVVVGAIQMEFPWPEMYIKEVRLLMARAYGPGSYDASYEKQGRDYPFGYVRWTENRNMQEFLRLLGQRQVDVKPLITHRFPLERGADAYNEILKAGSTSLAVVLDYPETPIAGGQTPPKPKTKVEVSAAPKGSGELGFALIGAGNLAKWAHLPALKKLSGASLRAVYSANGARGKGYANRFGANYCASSLDDILADKSVDAVLITSRNHEHAAQAEAALRAGKHVLVEKPMAITEEECRRLMAAVKESGKYLTVGFNRRFAPYYRDLKQAASRRTSPAVIAARVNSPGISGNYWMADPSIGGAILGEACHFVDLFRWLLDSEVESVSAYSLPTDVREPIGQNSMAASFHMSDGSVANLTYCTVGSSTSGGERVELFAQGVGAFTEDFKSFTLATGSRSRKSSWWAEKGYLAQLEDFAQAIRDGKPPKVTVEDGALSSLICLRMLESAREKAPRTVSLADLLDSQDLDDPQVVNGPPATAEPANR
jgi:predicted dehydrogenase/threonine dehydrogenase-like Zn-dependent dehydrogenase